MNLLQRWKQVSLNNKMMVISSCLMAVATILLTVAAFLQYLTYTKQLRAMEGQLDAMNRSLVIAVNATVATQNMAADSAQQAAISRNLVDQNKDLITAARTQAKASLIQANTSRISAKASQTSADAAKQSVEIAMMRENPRVFTTRVYLSKEPIDDQNTGNAKAIIEVENTGGTPADVEISTYARIFMWKYFIGRTPEQITSSIGSIRYVLSEKRPLTISTSVLADPKILTGYESARYVFVWGKLVYTDIFAKEVTFPFCYETPLSGGSLEMVPCHISPLRKQN
jgi:hypothetical protein